MGNCHLKCFSADTIVSPRFNGSQHFDFSGEIRTIEIPSEYERQKKTPRFGSKKDFARFSTAYNLDDDYNETEEFYQNEHTPKTTKEMIAELSAALQIRDQLENESLEILEIEALYRKKR